MSKVIRTVFFFLIFMPAFSYGATNSDEMINKIKNTYNNMSSFKGEFSQTLLHKESGTREKRDGTLKFQKPLLVRWETAKPNEEILVITGKEIWDYLPEEEIAYRYPMSLAQDSRSIIQVITGQAALSEDFKIKNLGTENSLAKFSLYPKEPNTQMVEALIWVDPASGHIKRAKVIDFYGNENDIYFRSFFPSDKIADSSFKFTPPKGIEVEDRRDRQIQEKELFK